MAVTASSTSELINLLKKASGGDVILLKPGNYGNLDINGINKSSMVTIKSANANDRAKFDSIAIDSSSYIRVENVHVDLPTNPGVKKELVSIDKGSKNIEFVGSEVNGKVDNVYTEGRGIFSGDATNITFKDNYVHDVRDGGVFLSTDNLKVVGNRFEDVRKDGMKFAGTDNVLVEDNIGPRRYHPEPGDHKDFIQFQGTTKNITIKGNVILPEDNITVQGIFIDDGNYSNVLIENNIIYNGLVRGISLGTDGSGSNWTVKNNTVLTIPDYGHSGSAIILPSGSSSFNNISSTNKKGSVGSNVTAQYTVKSEPTYYDNLYVNATKGAGLTIEDLRPVSGSLAESKGAYQRINELLGESKGGSGGSNNKSPNAADDNAETDEDASVTIPTKTLLANDSDPNGDALTVTSVGSASHGKTALSGNKVTYTPNSNYSGKDSFTYKISDGKGGSDTGKVNVTVRPTQDAPPAPVGDGSGQPPSGSAEPLLSLGSTTFDGSIGDAVVLPHAAGYERASGTVEMVFKADSLASQQALFSKDAVNLGDGGHLGVLLEGDDLRIRMQGTNNETNLRIKDVVDKGEEHHLAVTFGPSGLKAYLDGAKVGGNGWTNGLQGNEEPIVLGANQWLSSAEKANKLVSPFDGDILEFNLYGNALDANTIAKLASGGGGSTNNQSPGDDIVSVEARGTQARNEFAEMQIIVDGEVYGTQNVDANPKVYDFAVPDLDTASNLEIRFNNDFADKAKGEDRNLYVTEVIADGQKLDIADATYERDNSNLGDLEGRSNLFWAGELNFDLDALLG